MKLNLQPREKNLLWIGGLVALLAGAWVLVFNPGLAELDRLDRALLRAKRQARTIQTQVDQWQQLNRETRKLMGRLSGRTSTFSLAGELESLIRASGLTAQLASLRPLPSEEVPGGAIRVSADVKLQGARFAALVKLLYRLEYSAQMLTVTRLTITTAETGVDVSMRVLTLKPTE